MISVDNKILLIYLLLSQIFCIGTSWFKTQSPQEKDRQVDPPSWQRKSSDSRDVTRVGWVKVRAAGKRHRNEGKDDLSTIHLLPARNLMTCSKHQRLCTEIVYIDWKLLCDYFKISCQNNMKLFLTTPSLRGRRLSGPLHMSPVTGLARLLGRILWCVHMGNYETTKTVKHRRT